MGMFHESADGRLRLAEDGRGNRDTACCVRCRGKLRYFKSSPETPPAIQRGHAAHSDLYLFRCACTVWIVLKDYTFRRLLRAC